MSNPLEVIGVSTSMFEGLETSEVHKVARKCGTRLLATLHPDKTPSEAKRSQDKQERRRQRYNEINKALQQIEKFIEFRRHLEDLKDKEKRSNRVKVRNLERKISAVKNRENQNLTRIFHGIPAASVAGKQLGVTDGTIFEPDVEMRIIPIEHQGISSSFDTRSADEKAVTVITKGDGFLHRQEDDGSSNTGSMPLAVIKSSLVFRAFPNRSLTKFLHEIFKRKGGLPEISGTQDSSRLLNATLLRNIPADIFCSDILPFCDFTIDPSDMLCSYRVEEGSPVVAVEGTFFS